MVFLLTEGVEIAPHIATCVKKKKKNLKHIANVKKAKSDMSSINSNQLQPLDMKRS